MITLDPGLSGRGCGIRKKSGTYLCCDQSPNGKPIEHFIFDPGIPWPYELSRAPKIISDEKGINHIYLLIGEGAYKSPWFHIEETSRFGLSRLVSNNFPFQKLTPYQSEVRCIYPRGIPKFEFEGNENGNFYRNCKIKIQTNIDWSHIPLGQHEPNNLIENVELYRAFKFCTFAHRDISWWLATDKQRAIVDDKRFEIDFPSIGKSSFRYEGYFGTTNFEDESDSVFINKDNWQPAILLRLPLTHIEMPFVENEKSASKAREAGFDVFVLPY